MTIRFPDQPLTPGHVRVREAVPGERLSDHELRLQRAQAARESAAQHQLSGTHVVANTRSFLLQQPPIDEADVPGAASIDRLPPRLPPEARSALLPIDGEQIVVRRPAEDERTKAVFRELDRVDEMRRRENNTPWPWRNT